MTDCSSSLNGSTSSSSDVTSLRGGGCGIGAGISIGNGHTTNSSSNGNHTNGDCGSGSSSSNNNNNTITSARIRIVRLSRPHPEHGIFTGIANVNSPSFGFAIRGGREFGTGFFVSRIEPASEADIQGLRVGDQIIRVNGYHVEDSVHKELSQYISIQDRLTLKVRGVGIIPVKDRDADPLSWHIVPLQSHHHKCMNNIIDDVACRDIRITLSVAPRAKLGLGICKGPEWKPGIFVQFTKEASIANKAGLRPGDQILGCNNVDFSDILFSDAVAVMKSSHILELLVRTAAGLDLFPGESSGYNSSASSVTGDSSPCWGDQSSKRLSMVREECPDSPDSRYNRSRPKGWDRNDMDRRKERYMLVDPSPSPPPPPPPPLLSSVSSAQMSPSSISYAPLNYHTDDIRNGINYHQQHHQHHNYNNYNHPHEQIHTIKKTGPNTTIIHLSENGAIINNTLIPNNVNTPATNACNTTTTTTVHVGDRFAYGGAPNESPQIGSSAGDRSHDRSNIQINYTNGGGVPPSPPLPPQDHDNATSARRRGDNTKIADICFVTRQSETKTVIVEVHRSAAEEANGANGANGVSSAPPPPPAFVTGNGMSQATQLCGATHMRTPSVASSTVSFMSGSSLSSAIGEELKKRAERLKDGGANGEIAPKRIMPTPIGRKVDDRHNALMDEFKRAHQKMFKNGFVETATPKAVAIIDSGTATDEGIAVNDEDEDDDDDDHHYDDDRTNCKNRRKNRRNRRHNSRHRNNKDDNGVDDHDDDGDDDEDDNDDDADDDDDDHENGGPLPSVFAEKCLQQQQQQQQQQERYPGGGRSPIVDKDSVDGRAFNVTPTTAVQHRRPDLVSAESANGGVSRHNGQNGHTQHHRQQVATVQQQQQQLPPPPPPPPPSSSSSLSSSAAAVTTNGFAKTISAPPPPPPPQFQTNNWKTPSSGRSSISSFDSDSGPSTPSPDYDCGKQSYQQVGTAKSGTMGRVAATEMAKANGDAADMQSIESFTLANSTHLPHPRPPSHYFAPQSGYPPTMRKTQRPVSVTIGEYGHTTNKNGHSINRREPNKFDFIGRTNGGDELTAVHKRHSASNASSASVEDVSQRLKNELEMTLSRSNLKKRTELMQNDIYQNGGKPANKMVAEHNPVVPKLNGAGSATLKPVLQKTNIEKLTSMLSAHTLRVAAANGKQTDMATGKVIVAGIGQQQQQQPQLATNSSSNGAAGGGGGAANSPPNGILKHHAMFNGKNALAHSGNSSTTLEQKNISFGNM